jgi:membrane-associated protein
MGEFFEHFWLLIKAVATYDTQAVMATLSRPDFLVVTFVVLNLIIFTETGLLIGAFLPGDSLLVTAGIVFRNLIDVQGSSGWLLPFLMLTLSLAAIIGDTVGYNIGRKAGPRLFRREQSLFFRKSHLVLAQQFYERHGGKTIVLARFMPVLRAFAPVVAGVGQMHYRRFVAFNIVGGISWVCSMLLIGYFLPPLLNPVLRPVFGPEFQIEKHIEAVIIVVCVLSVLPACVAWLRHKLVKRKVDSTAAVL